MQHLPSRLVWLTKQSMKHPGDHSRQQAGCKAELQLFQPADSMH